MTPSSTRVERGLCTLALFRSPYLAVILVLQIYPGDSLAQAPPNVERQRSDRVSAAIAAGLGYEMQEWLTAARNPAAGGNDEPALLLRDDAIRKAAARLGVALRPSPSEARQAFPTERAGRIDYAVATIYKWQSQIQDHLVGDSYLQSHYLIGESIAYLRRFLASDLPRQKGAQSVVDMIASGVNERIGSSDVEISEQLRAQWIEITNELKSLDKLTPESSVSLRSRLGVWYSAFSAELAGKSS